MKASATRLFPLVLVLALALLTFWLERTVQKEEVHPSVRRHDPDYLVEQFVVTKFNAAGALESTVSAAKMVHYPDDDSTELVAPRVVQAKANEPHDVERGPRRHLPKRRGVVPVRQCVAGA